jgi:hypothetical protein
MLSASLAMPAHKAHAQDGKTELVLEDFFKGKTST